MKIAYLSCVLPPYPGGIGVAASGMATEMARRGHDARVWGPFPPLFKWGNAAFLPQLLWRLRGFEIIHLLYPFYGVAELTPFLRRTTRAKIVIQHMMDAVAPGFKGRFFKWHTRYLLPRIFRAADRVLVLSEDYARNSDVSKFDVPWAVVPLGVDTNLFRPILGANNESIANLRISNSQIRKFGSHSQLAPLTILFVGGLDRAHYFKGVPVLLEACRILKERGVQFSCQIVGEGEMRQKLEASSQKLGIAFVGLVSHDQLPAYYQQSTVVVVPATERIECFSMVAAEAQACGVPVIVTDFPGVRVTIENGVTGFVIPPSDAEALAERLQWLLEHSDEARAMGQAGRTRAEQRYSWKIVGDKLERIYESLYHP